VRKYKKKRKESRGTLSTEGPFSLVSSHGHVFLFSLPRAIHLFGPAGTAESPLLFHSLPELYPRCQVPFASCLIIPFAACQPL